MLISHILAAAAPTTARSLRRWAIHLGGLGFIPLGLLDSSVIPVPGSMDLLTMILAARAAEPWFYYAIMATLGSVIGAYVTYRLARKGGKETLARKISKAKMERAYNIFGRWGFGALAIAAMLPPPVPFVPFLLTAGAMRYSQEKFLAALTLGRIVRYSILAYLGARYGRHMIRYIVQHPHPVFIAVVVAIAAAAVIAMVILSSRRKKPAQA